MLGGHQPLLLLLLLRLAVIVMGGGPADRVRCGDGGMVAARDARDGLGEDVEVAVVEGVVEGVMRRLRSMVGWWMMESMGMGGSERMR